MSRIFLRLLPSALGFCILSVAAFAQPAEETAPAETDQPDMVETDGGTPKITPSDWTPKLDGVEMRHTHDTCTIGGETFPYTATAGKLPITNEAGETQAHMFFVSYTRDDIDDARSRPISFFFNGGPGSSSVWLHLGAFGPKRVEMGDAGSILAPPYRMIPNDGTILDVTDIVFIDPPTTGFSRAAEGVSPSRFHGLDEDSRVVSEFIRQYVSRFHRWSSPKFIGGESYGTTRAAALAGRLQGTHGMFLNGVILISSILDFSTARFDNNNDLPYILFLPTMTATAWYHGQLGEDVAPDLPAAIKAAEEFAMEEYASALLKGARLTSEERRAIAAKLARLLGVDAQFVLDRNLRVSMGSFCKELLRDDARTVGRLDSRFIGIDRTPAGESYSYDSSYAAIQGPYTAALNDYVRGELKWEDDLPYEILSGRVRPWNYGRFENRYVDVSDTLRSAMTQNQAMRVFLASGYYDFATPYFAADHVMAHMKLDTSLRDNIDVEYYEAGHMMYVHADSRRKLRDDLVRYFETTLQSVLEEEDESAARTGPK